MNNKKNFIDFNCRNTIKFKDGRYLSVVDGCFYGTLNKSDRLFFSDEEVSVVIREVFGPQWNSVCSIEREDKTVQKKRYALKHGVPEEKIATSYRCYR